MAGTPAKRGEPAPWVPAVAVAAIPGTAAAAAAFGSAGAAWAIGAILIGLFVFLFLMALWVVEGNRAGIAYALAFALVGSVLVTAALLGFSRLAGELEPPSPVPTTPPSPTTQVTPVPTTAAGPGPGSGSSTTAP